MVYKRQQWKIPIYRNKVDVKLIWIIDYEGDHVYCEKHEKYDAVVFLEFFKKVLTQYTNGVKYNNIFFKSLVSVRIAIQNFIDTINKVTTQTIDMKCVKM